MSEALQREVVVLGDADWASGPTVQRVDGVDGALAGVDAGADCLVCEHAPPRVDGLAALERVREHHPDLPVLLWTAAPDGTTAAAATRLDVTEYLVRSGLDDEGLADRVAAVARAGRPSATGERGVAPVHDPTGSSYPTDTGAGRILDRVDDGVLAVDGRWRLTYVNDRAGELLGALDDDLVGRDARTAFPDPVSDVLFANCRAAMETGTSATVEEYLAGRDLWLEISVYPAPDGLSVYFRDVGERRRHERALSRLLGTSRELMTAETVEDIASVTVEAAAEILDFEVNGVRLFDTVTGKLELAATTERAAGLLQDREGFAPGEGIIGRAYESNETVVAEDVRDSETRKHEGVRSAMAVPLGRHGTLAVGRTSAQPLRGTDRDLLELLGLSAESALDRASRESALREFRAVHDTGEQMVYTLDHEGRVSLVTEPLADRLDYDRAELIGRPARKLLGAEATAHGERLLRELIDDQPEATRTYEVTLEPREGEPFPAEVDVSLLRSDGVFEGSVGVVRDVSALHRARAQLADERDRFSYLFERLPEAVAEVELVEGSPHVRGVNPAFESVFGYDAETVTDRPLAEFVLPSGSAEQPPELRAVTEGADETRQVVERRTAEGRRQFIYTAVGFGGETGTTRGFVIYTDVSDLRDRERRLKVLHRVLRHNLRNDMNVVAGNAVDLRQALGDRDPDLASLARAIEERAADVAEISDQARYIERAMRAEWADPSDARHGVAIRQVVSRAVDQVRQAHPAATVDVVVPPSVEVRSAGGLEQAVEHVVENAVIHTDVTAPDARVRLEAVPDRPGWVDLRIEDEGPGLPPRERSVLSDEAEITPLQHSRGLGLWTARWIVEGAGGSVRFEEGPDGGTVVVFRLRAVEE